jgi:hypothetical protein
MAIAVVRRPKPHVVHAQPIDRIQHEHGPRRAERHVEGQDRERERPHRWVRDEPADALDHLPDDPALPPRRLARARHDPRDEDRTQRKTGRVHRERQRHADGEQECADGRRQELVRQEEGALHPGIGDPEVRSRHEARNEGAARRVREHFGGAQREEREKDDGDADSAGEDRRDEDGEHERRPTFATTTIWRRFTRSAMTPPTRPNTKIGRTGRDFDHIHLVLECGAEEVSLGSTWPFDFATPAVIAKTRPLSRLRKDIRSAPRDRRDAGRRCAGHPQSRAHHANTDPRIRRRLHRRPNSQRDPFRATEINAEPGSPAGVSPCRQQWRGGRAASPSNRADTLRPGSCDVCNELGARLKAGGTSARMRRNSRLRLTTLLRCERSSAAWLRAAILTSTSAINHKYPDAAQNARA